MTEQRNSAAPSPVVVPTDTTIELTLPPSPTYLSIVRTTAAALAVRVDFTVEEIEDLRMAVDEACVTLLPYVADSDRLECTFSTDADSLTLTVATTVVGTHPDPESFAWTVLEALADELSSGRDDAGRSWVRLTKRRAARSPGRTGA